MLTEDEIVYKILMPWQAHILMMKEVQRKSACIFLRGRQAVFLYNAGEIRWRPVILRGRSLDTGDRQVLFVPAFPCAGAVLYLVNAADSLQAVMIHTGSVPDLAVEKTTCGFPSRGYSVPEKGKIPLAVVPV